MLSYMLKENRPNKKGKNKKKKINEDQIDKCIVTERYETRFVLARQTVNESHTNDYLFRKNIGR